MKMFNTMHTRTGLTGRVLFFLAAGALAWYLGSGIAEGAGSAGEFLRNLVSLRGVLFVLVCGMLLIAVFFLHFFGPFIALDDGGISTRFGRGPLLYWLLGHMGLRGKWLPWAGIEEVALAAMGSGERRRFFAVLRHEDERILVSLGMFGFRQIALAIVENVPADAVDEPFRELVRRISPDDRTSPSGEPYY